MARERRKPRRANLSELIAAKDYGQAIELLREQLGQRPPGIQRRLQLADLLLLAGRRDEALPILETIAGELMNDGFAAKAVAILKRIDKLDPGRPDVEARLAQLAHRPVRPVPAPAAEVPAGPPEPEPESAVPDPSAEPTPPAEEKPAEAHVSPPEEPKAEVPPTAEAPVVPVDTPRDTTPPSDAAPSPEGSGFTGMLKRLFTMLPHKSEEGAAISATDGSIAESPAAASSVAENPVADSAATESRTAESPAVESPATSEASPAAAAVSEAPDEPTEEAPATKAESAGSEVADAIPAPESASAPLPPSDDAAPAPEPAPAPNVVEKLGGVFKKFLAALPGAGDDDELDSEVAAREFVAALASSGLDQDDDEGEFIAAFIDDDAAPSAAEAEADAATAPAPDAADDSLSEAVQAPAPATAAPRAGSGTPITEADFRDQVLDLLEQVLKQPGEATDALVAPTENTEPLAAAYRDTLLVHPLFSDLSPDEMLAVLRALRLVFVEPGDIIVTEGEPGASLFLIISGDVLLFVRNPAGHNVAVGQLGEGTFFGEMSLLSGKPRNATVTAGSRVEMLELPKALLDGIAQAHPRVRDIVDALYLQRANSPEVAAVRNVPTGNTDATRERAHQVLRNYFGGRRFEPRMQLKLATVLLKAGKYEEAVPVLVTIANELLRDGDTPKAIAILKKVERIRRRSLEEMNLAPLAREEEFPAPPLAPPTAAPEGRTEAFFAQWLSDTVRRATAEAQTAPSRPIPGFGPGLRANPLFEGFTEEELLAFIQGLRLLTFEPGEIILTEGESGESVLILAAGAVKVSVRDPTGRSVILCELHEGAFFGEISTLSGRPRSATVTAAWNCELLELDGAALESIATSHPRVRQVLEDAYIERAASPEAARIRTAGRPQPEA